MKAVVLYQKVAFDSMKCGISAYHARFFHGDSINQIVDDNNLGDSLFNNLKLNKNAFNCKYIFQTQRNLIISDLARIKLLTFNNIGFFQVYFNKLFFFEYHKHDHSFGPADYRELNKWVDSFQHVEALREKVGNFYELILPSYDRVQKEYLEAPPVPFNLESWRTAHLNLSSAMLEKYPGIWSTEGIILRHDLFELIEEFFCWDYFHKVEILVD